MTLYNSILHFNSTGLEGSIENGELKNYLRETFSELRGVEIIDCVTNVVDYQGNELLTALLVYSVDTKSMGQEGTVNLVSKVNERFEKEIREFLEMSCVLFNRI